LAPSDTNRKKRPKRGKRTSEENAARGVAESRPISVKLQEKFHANGTFQKGVGRPIKAEYYCAEYKDAIDIRNAALVTALKEARAIIEVRSASRASSSANPQEET